MSLPAPETITVATLANGVRVLTLQLPHLQTAAVSVFVRSGSQNESARQNGISHFVEHMAFKGTATRDCQRINLDAEMLGAEVNAHTDKDHTAFHMHGLAADAGSFVRMLGDIVLNGRFPQDELERERRVIVQEFNEDADDAVSTGFKLFDKLCFGEHPLARPVIGNLRNIERFSRSELAEYVSQQYSGANIVVGVAGGVDPDAMRHAADEVFGAIDAGQPNTVAPPDQRGGICSRRVGGYSQAHVVLGFPVPSLRQPHQPAQVAAALFGDGMSSPLLDELRERRGLVYHAACSADIGELYGQFVIEASTTPEHLDAFFTQVARLLAEHAASIDARSLARARNQLRVRQLRLQERAAQRLEVAVQDLFTLGRVRSPDEMQQQLQDVDAQQVRASFEQMLATELAVAVTGKIGATLDQRVAKAFSGVARLPRG